MTIATYWTLKKQWTVAFVVLLLFGSTPLVAAASSKSSCPGAGKPLLVVYLQPNTSSAAVGGTILITVGVTYTDFSTVTLSPQTVSFRWVSTAGERIVENAPVTGSGAGLYTYEQKVGDDFPTGTVTIFVLACSCSDGKGNYGPNADASSDTTYREEDNSKLEIGATTATPSGGIPGFPMESILIGLITAFAILALLRRRHASDTASSVRARPV